MVTSTRARSWCAGALIAITWLRTVLPDLLSSYTTQKSAAASGAPTSMAAGASSLNHLLRLLLLAAALLIILFAGRVAVLRHPWALAALLLPCAYVYLRDEYNSYSVGLTNALIFPAIGVAIWLLHPPLRSLQVLGYLIGALAIGSIAMGLLTPSAGLLNLSDGSDRLDKQLFGAGVLVGPFGSENMLGPLLSIGAPTVLLIERRRLRWALFAVVGAAVLWSSSRNSIVTMAVLVLVAAAARGAQARMRPLVGAAAGAAALAVVVLTPLVVSNPASFTNRGLIWQQSLLAWADNPLFGLGSNWYATQLTSSSVIASSVTQGHNQFIHALTTGGAVLVLLTAALCGALLLSAARSAARGSLFGVWYVVAYFASFWLEPGLTFADQDYAFPVTIVPIAFVLFAQADESDDEPASAAEREGPARRAPALARIARHLAARQPAARQPAARQPAGRQPAGRQPAERQPERQPAARQLADR